MSLDVAILFISLVFLSSLVKKKTIKLMNHFKKQVAFDVCTHNLYHCAIKYCRKLHIKTVS